MIKDLGKICEHHYMDYHNKNINRILEDEHVNIGGKKYTCPLQYIRQEMKSDMPDFVNEKSVNETFTKVKEEVRELRLEKELTMTMRF